MWLTSICRWITFAMVIYCILDSSSQLFTYLICWLQHSWSDRPISFHSGEHRKPFTPNVVSNARMLWISSCNIPSSIMVSLCVHVLKTGISVAHCGWTVFSLSSMRFPDSFTDEERVARLQLALEEAIGESLFSTNLRITDRKRRGLPQTLSGLQNMLEWVALD